LEKVAVIGTGVAGLGCAWNLRDVAKLSLFEKDNRPGGHTNTVSIQEGTQDIPIDTGFIVFNKVTYPNLCRLFEELGVTTKPSEMSFSVQHLPSSLEYNGMGFNKLFAQKKNLFSPRFLGLLRQIFRFFKVANEALQGEADMTVGEFVKKHRLGQDFLELYLIPMSSAVWSTEPNEILSFPAQTLIRFFHNHGFLGVSTHHPWFTVDGGSRTYVKKILQAVGDVEISSEAVSVESSANSAKVTFSDGHSREFDRVILACHADQALRLLANPTDDQVALLKHFRYQKNDAALHTWSGLMPKRRIAWASWNYRVTEQTATTHYWMNALQGVSEKQNYFVSLNSNNVIPEQHILYRTTYEHPVFTQATTRAQKHLPSLNTITPEQRVFFCGSYFRYGFHEDAYTAGFELSLHLREVLKP